MKRPFKDFRKLVLIDTEKDVSDTATDIGDVAPLDGNKSTPKFGGQQVPDMPSEDELEITSFTQE